MTQPLDLTMDECVRLKLKLDRVETEGTVPDLQDILAEIKTARITGLQARCSAALQTLCCSSDHAPCRSPACIWLLGIA